MDKRKVAALFAAVTMTVASGAVALAANFGLLTLSSANAKPGQAVSRIKTSPQPKVVTVFQDVTDPAPAVSGGDGQSGGAPPGASGAPAAATQSYKAPAAQQAPAPAAATPPTTGAGSGCRPSDGGGGGHPPCAVPPRGR